MGEANPNKLRILVVEDDADAAEALSDLLDMLGHTPATALNGGKAVELAPEFAPELVLCDLTLPGLDGFGVARALRAHPATARTPLVALSGHSGAEVGQELRAAGFDLHLAKPVRLEDLNRVLERVAAHEAVSVGAARGAARP